MHWAFLFAYGKLLLFLIAMNGLSASGTALEFVMHATSQHSGFGGVVVEEKSGKTIGFGWIVFSFIFVQPLGMLLLCLRFILNRKDVLKGAWTIFKTSAVFFALFWVFMLVDYTGMEDFFYSLYLFGAGSLIGFTMFPFMLTLGCKDAKYRIAVEKTRLVKLQDIASAVNMSEAIAARDLQKLIDCGAFPNGKLDMNNEIFILNKYDHEREQTRTFRCSGCGATVVAVNNKGGVCEYCGSPVNY